MDKNKNNQTIWSARIKKSTSTVFQKVGSSIDIDKRLIQEDISVTRAHVDALFKLGVINKSDLSKIKKENTTLNK